MKGKPYPAGGHHQGMGEGALHPGLDAHPISWMWAPCSPEQVQPCMLCRRPRTALSLAHAQPNWDDHHVCAQGSSLSPERPAVAKGRLWGWGKPAEQGQLFINRPFPSEDAEFISPRLLPDGKRPHCLGARWAGAGHPPAQWGGLWGWMAGGPTVQGRAGTRPRSILAPCSHCSSQWNGHPRSQLSTSPGFPSSCH